MEPVTAWTVAEIPRDDPPADWPDPGPQQAWPSPLDESPEATAETSGKAPAASAAPPAEHRPETPRSGTENRPHEEVRDETGPAAPRPPVDADRAAVADSAPEPPPEQWRPSAAPTSGDGRNLSFRERHSADIAAGRSAVAQHTAPAPVAEPEPDEPFVPSADDETVESSGLMGKAAIERLLGGVVIDQRDKAPGGY